MIKLKAYAAAVDHSRAIGMILITESSYVRNVFGKV